MSECLISERLGRVQSIRLNRPASMNAIDMDLRRALLAAFDAAGRDPGVSAVVLGGSGKAFCSGSDLKGAAASTDSSLRRTARTLTHDYQPILETIMRLDKPVIAAVNGAAAGFGMSLVLACDLVVMAQEAYLASPFINIGLIPDGGATWQMVRRLVYVRAFEMLAEGQKLGAEQCCELGLANRVVTADALQQNALEWAERLASRAPLALGLTKRMARLAQNCGMSDAMAMEAEMQTFLAS